MWCDNCLLVLPLRAGAIAWAVVIAAYSIAGSVFLFIDGQFLFFHYPEWDIYGGIGMAVAAIAIINAIALSNRSYIWIRVCKFVWPFLIVISLVRAIAMIVELQLNKSKVAWECANGGRVWTATAAANATTTATAPAGFCTAGYTTLNEIFIVALIIDLVFQMYMLFLNWRFSKRLEHYQNMKGPYGGGYYNAF